jgi:hypothetical protein
MLRALLVEEREARRCDDAGDAPREQMMRAYCINVAQGYWPASWQP